MKIQIQYAFLLMVPGSLLTISCQKDITTPQPAIIKNSAAISTGNSVKEKNAKKITVSTMTELYAAVSNVSNVGVQVLLEPGTYTLTAAGGRLELQKDMELLGSPGHPDSVIIDASALPPSTFSLTIPGGPQRTGAIRTGNGFNSIEWLTVIGNPNMNAFSAIDTDLSSASASVRFAHLVVMNSQIAISIRNAGINSSGRVLEAEIVDNELINNQVASGQGISIQNSINVTDAEIYVTMNGNRSHGNKIGLRAWNQHANYNTIIVQSHNDDFDGNGIGVQLNGGTDTNPATIMTTANGNFISFEAHGSRSCNNSGLVPPFPPDVPPASGFYLAGGVTSAVANRASDNILEVKLWGCQVSGNQGADINAFGARSLSGGIAGIKNIVNLYLYGVSANATVLQDPSFPDEAGGTNIVNVFR